VTAVGTARAAAADVVIVGAGLAGLTAAQALVAAGASVVVLDKGRRPGGRCATRLLDGEPLDSGAQFFTVRSDAFRALVDRWRGEGVPIRGWGRGFAQAATVAADPSTARTEADGHPRYGVTGGMNGLAAHLAKGLDVRCGVQVTRVDRSDGRWTVTARDGAVARGGALVLTPPVPQALALLDAGGIALPAGVDARLRGMDYERCLALLARLTAAPGLPAPGGVQFAGGPVTWLADDVAKGVAGRPAVTVHAGPEHSAQHYEDPNEVVVRDLLAAVRPWLSGAAVTAAEVVRWRYAKPVAPTDEGVVAATVDGGTLVIAGDALAGAKVEGAVTSGLAAADLANPRDRGIRTTV